jgi:Sulfotransferase domain
MAEAGGISEASGRTVSGQDGATRAEAAAGRPSEGSITTSGRMPNFFVIGAPRSGTTSLYEYLAAHRDVFMSTVKEPDFFIRPSLALAHPLGGTERADLDADGARFEELAKDLQSYRSLFAGASGQARVGEASAIYLGNPIAPWHLRGYVPDAKLIAVLRNPTERAFSHLVHARRIYAEHGQVGAIGAEGTSVDEAFATAVDTALRDGPFDETKSDPEVWVQSGFYHLHLTRFLSYFPAEQLKAFLFEDLSERPRELMREIFGFLGVDDTFELPTTEAFNASVVPRSQRLFSIFTTKNSLMRKARALAPTKVRAVAMRTRNRLLGAGKPPLDPGLGSKLEAIYRDDVLALQDHLGRDLSGWLGEGAGGQSAS